MRVVEVIGDSIGLGYDTVPLLGWSQLAAMPPGYSVINRSVSGRTIVGNSTNSVTDHLSDVGGVLATYNAATPRVLVAAIGSNDIAGGADAATTLALYWTLLATLRSACPADRLVAVPPLPRGETNLGSAQQAADVLTFGAAILAGWTTHADRCVDFNVEHRFDNPETNPIFQDTCHPIRDGQALMAALWVQSRAWV